MKNTTSSFTNSNTQQEESKKLEHPHDKQKISMFGEVFEFDKKSNLWTPKTYGKKRTTEQLENDFEKKETFQKESKKLQENTKKKVDNVIHYNYNDFDKGGKFSVGDVAYGNTKNGYDYQGYVDKYIKKDTEKPTEGNQDNSESENTINYNYDDFDKGGKFSHESTYGNTDAGYGYQGYKDESFGEKPEEDQEEEFEDNPNTPIDSEAPETEIETPEEGETSGITPIEEPIEEVEVPDEEDEEPEEITPEKEEEKVEVPETSNLLSANISDVEEVLWDKAYHKGAERMRAEHDKRGFFGKLKGFFTDASKKKKYRKEEIEKLRGNMFDAMKEQASDRYQKSNSLLDRTDINTTHTINSPAINQLANAYIQGAISKTEFESEFSLVLERDHSTDLSEIKEKGSNILLVLDRQRLFHEFLEEIEANPSVLDTMQSLPIVTKQTIEQTLGLKVHNNFDEIKKVLADTNFRRQLLDKQFEIQLSILTGGERAYNVDNSEREDNLTYKYGNFLRKNPIAKIAINAGAIAFGSIWGPVGNMIAGTAVMGKTAGVRRYADLTSEQKGYERRVTQGIDDLAKVYQIKKDLEAKIASAKGVKGFFLKRQLSSINKKIELYESSMPKNLKTTEEIGSQIEALLANENIDTNSLTTVMADALARLDGWKATGHNFLKSTDLNNMEAGYNTLYNNILYGTSAINIDLPSLRKTETYTRVRDEIVAEFNETDKNFKSNRTKSGLKYGSLSAGAYAGGSLLGQWIAGTGFWDSQDSLFAYNKTIPGNPGVSQTSYNIDAALEPKLSTLFTNPQDYIDFKDNLRNVKTPEELWTLLVDIKGNTQLGNADKNEIIKFIFDATEVQNGVTKPELAILANKHGLISDINGNTQRVQDIFSLMSKWGYTGFDKQQLLDNIVKVTNGTLDPNTLSIKDQELMAEYMFCYVHKNTQAMGSDLFELFFDTTKETIGATDDKKYLVDPSWVKSLPYLLPFAAIGTMKNTHMSPITDKTQEDKLSDTNRKTDNEREKGQTANIQDLEKDNHSFNNLERIEDDNTEEVIKENEKKLKQLAQENKQKLEELGRKREKGEITEEEYTAKGEELLNDYKKKAEEINQSIDEQKRSTIDKIQAQLKKGLNKNTIAAGAAVGAGAQKAKEKLNSITGKENVEKSKNEKYEKRNKDRKTTTPEKKSLEHKGLENINITNLVDRIKNDDTKVHIFGTNGVTKGHYTQYKSKDFIGNTVPDGYHEKVGAKYNLSRNQLNSDKNAYIYLLDGNLTLSIPNKRGDHRDGTHTTIMLQDSQSLRYYIPLLENPSNLKKVFEECILKEPNLQGLIGVSENVENVFVNRN